MVRKKNIGELIWPLNLNVVLQVCFHSTPVLVGELQTNFLVYSDRLSFNLRYIHCKNNEKSRKNNKL